MSVQIHPSAVVAETARLGEGVEIGPFCEVGSDVELGAGVRLHARASVTGHTKVGAGCELHSGAALGGSPQSLGFIPDSASRLEVGAGCIFREFATAHTGTPAGGGVTRVGAEGYFMIGAHIGHDCQVGEKCVISNYVSLAGHVTLGREVWIGGHAAIHQFCEVGDHAFIAGGSILLADVIPFAMVSGHPAGLDGLNVRGLKRRGFSREAIGALRAACSQVFGPGEGTVAERAEAAKAAYPGDVNVAAMADFALAPRRRGLCIAGGR